MRNHRIPREFDQLVRQFESCFSSRSAANFATLVIGWIACGGRRSISRVVEASGACGAQHFSTLYRFFSRAVWDFHSVTRVLVAILVARIDGDVEVAIDDTLCRRRGPHFFGAAMHRDGASSSCSGATGARPVFAFGHNWVVLSIALALPWSEHQKVAIPVMFRLYRSKKRCPEALYRKKTELAREMIAVLRGLVPAEKRVLVAGDSEYACSTVLKDLPDGVEFVGPIRADAHLVGPPPNYKGSGRPCSYGAQEPTPGARFGSEGGPWRDVTIPIYGCKVKLKVKTAVTRWRAVTGSRPVRLVLTRDPSGRLQDRAYFSTDVNATPSQILTRVATRWTIEVCFRDLKQLFGFGDAQNGWGKRDGARGKKIAGPQPRGTKGRAAIERTAPFAALVYAIVVLWYIDSGRAERDVADARRAAPWYTKKATPSVQDMLIALRGEILARRLSRDSTSWRDRARIIRAIPRGLLAA